MWRRREGGGFLVFLSAERSNRFHLHTKFCFARSKEGFFEPPAKKLNNNNNNCFFSNKLVSERLQKKDFYQSKGTFLICTSPHRVLDPTTQPGK